MEAEYPFHTALLLLLLVIVGIRMYFNGYADAASGVSRTPEGEGAFRILRVLLGFPCRSCISRIRSVASPPAMVSP